VRLLTHLVLAGELDVTAFRPVKEASLRRQMHWGRTTLYESLKRLAITGYLERSAAVPGEAREYRLVYSVSLNGNGHGHVRGGERTNSP